MKKNLKCRTCKYYIKPTPEDVIILRLKQADKNISNTTLIKEFQRFCKVKGCLADNDCQLYVKKWYVFW